MTTRPWEPIDLGCTFPFRHLCRRCANEQSHHHVGPKTKGMMHEGGPEYCWCLDIQEPGDVCPNAAASLCNQSGCHCEWGPPGGENDGQADRTHHHRGDDPMIDRTESEILRSLLWLNHSRHHNLYGEGGFLWCNVCQVDFRTSTAEEIERRFTQLANEIRPPGESDLQTQSGLTLAEQIKIERDKLRQNLDRALNDYDTVAHQRQYLQARIEELELLVDRVRSERDQIKGDVDKIKASSPHDIMARGWDVVAHHTDTEPVRSIWVFIRGLRAIRGEGESDSEALDEVRSQLNPVAAYQSDVPRAALS